MATTINYDLQERLFHGEHGPYTVADYMEIPQDQIRFQLMRGWLVREPSPREIHQRVVGNLHFCIRIWVNDKKRGEVYIAPFDTVLSSETVLQPDLLVISTERSSLITAANVQGAPDLVIEVLSESTARRDQIVKQSLYKEAGVLEMWLVYTDEHRVDVICLQQSDFQTLQFRGKETVSSPHFGPMGFAVDDLFTRVKAI